MTARITLILATALAISAIAGGCGDDESSTGAATTTAATTAAGPAFSDFQPLKAGRRYTTTVFKPAVQFSVPPGSWSTEVGDTAEHFAVAAEDPAGATIQAIVGVHRITSVYDPDRGGKTPGDRVAFKGRFADWLREHPRLRTTAPKRIELMGLEGVQVDVTNTRSEPPRIPDDCGKIGPRCVPLFYDGIDAILYTSTTKGRFAVLALPDGGELVVEQWVEPAGAFAQGLRTLQPLVGGLTLADG